MISWLAWTTKPEGVMARYVVYSLLAAYPNEELAITESEHGKVCGAIATLHHAIDVEEKYVALIDNYYELEMALLEEALRTMIYSYHDAVAGQSPINLISRRMINFLSSARLYLDSLPQHAGKILNQSNEAFTRVKDALKEAYDRCLGYRVMEALRNYSQHEAFPVHSWSAEWSRDASVQPHQVRYSVDPKLDLKILSASHFKKSVLNELLEERLETTQLKPFIRAYVEELGRVQQVFRESTADQIAESKGCVEGIVSRFTSNFPNVEARMLVAIEIDESGRQIDEPVYLTGPLINDLARLQRTIRSMQGYSQRRVEY
jgi:hypothetical protein